MQPSTSMRLKDLSTPAFSAACNWPALTTASVVMTHSMVASWGAIMPEPLTMPPTRNPVEPSSSTVFALVSVVMMAWDASAPAWASSARASYAFWAPESTLSSGSSSPIRPVEHTATSSAFAPSKPATFSAVAFDCSYPGLPVQALAPPELRITAFRWPSLTTERDHCTGAAQKRFDVNTPAAASSGPLLTTRARSFLPSTEEMPAVTPAAEKPCANVTLTVPLQSLSNLRLQEVPMPHSATAPLGRPCRG